MNYVDPQHELATTVVKDKYGIIPLANDLLLALHYAEMSSLEFEDRQALKDEMNSNIAVVDALVQLEMSMVSLSQELGGTLTSKDEVASANDAPTPDTEEVTAGNQNDLHSLSHRATALSKALAQHDNKTSIAKYDPIIQKLVHELNTSVIAINKALTHPQDTKLPGANEELRQAIQDFEAEILTQNTPSEHVTINGKPFARKDARDALIDSLHTNHATLTDHLAPDDLDTFKDLLHIFKSEVDTFISLFGDDYAEHAEVAPTELATFIDLFQEALNNPLKAGKTTVTNKYGTFERKMNMGDYLEVLEDKLGHLYI